jgi:hypothetical protein
VSVSFCNVHGPICSWRATAVVLWKPFPGSVGSEIHVETYILGPRRAFVVVRNGVVERVLSPCRALSSRKQTTVVRTTWKNHCTRAQSCALILFVCVCCENSSRHAHIPLQSAGSRRGLSEIRYTSGKLNVVKGAKAHGCLKITYMSTQNLAAIPLRCILRDGC